MTIAITTTPPSALPPGAAGKVGHLHLEFAPRHGRTVLLTARRQVPLHVGRVLHPQPDWPELAHVMVTMPTGGLVQGDSISMRVRTHPGAAAHVTSQSASRAYRCEGQPIAQQIHLQACGDSLLEWWPDPLIPYARTVLFQRTELVVDESATLLVADSWLAGRVARGEIHAYAYLQFSTIVYRPDGRLLFRDTLRLQPDREHPASLGLLGDFRAIGSFYLLGPTLAPCLESPLAVLLAQIAPRRAAVTRLPADCGLLVRLVATSSDTLRIAKSSILALARARLFGRSIAPPFKP